MGRNRLYRSAEFPWNDASEAPRFLERVGVRRVIDLRCQSECENADGAHSSLERVHIPFLESIEQRSFQPVDRSPLATAERYYEYLLEGRTAFSKVLDTLIDVPSKPTVIHCVSGRDRTGITVACVLSLLKVSDEWIARDYAESHVMDDAEGRNAHPDNILHLLRIIRELHGSVEGILGRDGYGPASHAQLRRALLDA